MLLLMARKEISGQNFWQSLGVCPLVDHTSDECFFPLKYKYSQKMLKNFRVMKHNALYLWPLRILVGP